MRGHPLLLLLLGVIACGVAWWVTQRSERPRLVSTPEAPAGAPSPTAREPSPVPAATRTQEPPGQPDELAEDTTSRDAPDTDATIPGPVDGILVQGTVTVTDARGFESSDTDGSFTAIAWEGDGGSRCGVVPVRGGRFRLRVPRGHDLGVSTLVLSGRLAHVENERLTVLEDRPVEIHARWGASVVLHVVDVRSRTELPDVTVVVVHEWTLLDAAFPGTIDPSGQRVALVQRGDSPLELAGPAPRSKLLWKELVRVRTPRTAWKKVLVDFLQGGETTIELAPGADLEVTLHGEIPPAPASQKISFDDDLTVALLRLRGSGVLLAEVPPDHPGPTRLEGLIPGNFELTLERGKSWDRPQVLGTATVDLVAGTTTHAVLTLAAPVETRRRVPLGGTLRLSPEWDCHWLDLRFEPLDVRGGTSLETRGLLLKDLEPVPGNPALYRFELLPVLPGRYLVKSYVFTYQQIVETGAAGRDDLEIEIGDPADVVVHLIDDLTDLPVHESNVLMWNCRWPEETTGGGLNAMTWDDTQQAWCFRAPAGEIELHVGREPGTAANFQPPGLYEPLGRDRFVTVHPGRNELTLRARRTEAR